MLIHQDCGGEIKYYESGIWVDKKKMIPVQIYNTVCMKCHKRSIPDKDIIKPKKLKQLTLI